MQEWTLIPTRFASCQHLYLFLNTFRDDIEFIKSISLCKKKKNESKLSLYQWSIEKYCKIVYDVMGIKPNYHENKTYPNLQSNFFEIFKIYSKKYCIAGHDIIHGCLTIQRIAVVVQKSLLMSKPFSHFSSILQIKAHDVHTSDHEILSNNISRISIKRWPALFIV